jgi:hypothetical protein
MSLTVAALRVKRGGIGRPQSGQRRGKMIKIQLMPTNFALGARYGRVARERRR